MSYDETLADRVRRVLAARADVVEKAMFGGLCFMTRRHMCCGLVGDDLMLRVGPAACEDALAQPHVRPMDFTGRPMAGMIFVEPEGVGTTRALGAWIDRALAYVETLPVKSRPTRRRRSPQAVRRRGRR